MPRIKLCLQIIALSQQRAVDWHKTRQHIGKSLPQSTGFNAGSSERLCLDEIDEGGRNLQSGAIHIFWHIRLQFLMVPGETVSLLPP